MLSDQDLASRITANIGTEQPQLVSPFPREGTTDWSAVPPADSRWNGKDSPIQPASVDLHVGKIFIPGTRDGELGSADNGATSHTLRTGRSVIVSTYERLSIPADLGGIVFPPSKLSSSGILVANIGHVDPGFEGALRFTIINMGGTDFALERGKVAVGTLMLFKLSTPSLRPWLSRHEQAMKGEPAKTEIEALAEDFANVDRRIDRLATRRIRREAVRFSLLAILLPIVFGFVVAYAGLGIEWGRSLYEATDTQRTSITQLQASMATLEATTNTRLHYLQAEVDRVRAQLHAAESEPSSPSPGSQRPSPAPR